jgi:hypothetical protein
MLTSKTSTIEETGILAQAEIPLRQAPVWIDDVSGSTGTRERIRNFPGHFTGFMFRHHGLAIKICLMALVFISALYTKAYTGDFQMVINNHIGGILYVVFGSLAFSILFPRMKLLMPVTLATAGTCFLEFVQWFRFPFMVELTRIKFFAYLFGNSYNPADFIYYGMGSVLAILVLWFIREN